MKWLIPLFILVFFEGVADILAKYWSLRGGWWFAILALIAYLVANSFWLFALKNGSGLAKGAVIFSISSALVATLLGVFLYNEDLTKIQYLGILFGVASLILIFWK